MKKIRTSFFSIVALMGICFAVLIIYVSLSGENNKIETVVDNFFKNIQEQQYFSFEDNQNIVKSLDVFDIDGEYSANCLFLELSLLDKYDISDASDYKIDIQKSHFWIPFIRNKNIHINVSLKKKEDRYFFSIFKKSQKPEFVDNLFTVERNDGMWRITSINIQSSPLLESINSLRESLNIDSYISASETKLTVNPIEIDTANITNVERRKLNYIFQKLYQLTEAS